MNNSNIQIPIIWLKKAHIFPNFSKAIMGEVLTEHFLTIFVHTFWEIGGVLFWQGDIFSSQLGSF